jgi:outer membrane protein TolC
MAKSSFILFLVVFIAFKGYSQSRALDYYLSSGLSNSPFLRDFDNQLRLGSIDSLIALCAFKPQVDLSSQALVAPVGNNLGYDEAITNGGNYAAVVGVKQSLFNNKVKTAQFQNISLLKQSLGINKIITQSDLKKGITLQYITAYADYNQMQFNRKLMELLTDQQKAVKLLVAAGIYQETDLMNLAIAGKAQGIGYRQAFNQYKNDIALLNLISGLVDTTTVELAAPDLELNDHYDIRQSPVMMQSGIDSLKNSNARQLINLNYRPRLEAFADAGFMAVKPLNIPHNFGTTFGLNLSVPVYDGKQRVQEYNKIEIAEKSRTLYRDFYTTQYWQQHLQLTEQLRLNDTLIRDIGLQLSQQLELLDLYKLEMENGLLRFTDYLSAISNYSTTQNSLTIAQMNRLQLINQLNFLK